MSDFFDGPPPKVEFKTVTVGSLYDIRRIISEFSSVVKPSTTAVKTIMPGFDNQGRPVNFQVEAPLDCDYQSLLKQGMDMLKRRAEIIEKAGSRANRLIAMDSRTWVDNLIERRLGGRREGLRIRWEVPDGVFYWDPTTGKLTQCTPSSPSSV